MSWEIVDDVEVSSPQQTGVAKTQSSVTPEITRGSDIPVPSELQRLMRVGAKDRVSALLTGGLPAVSGGAKESEDVLPMVNGTLGGILGTMVGRPEAGMAVGTSVGEAEKQVIDRVSGSRSKINVNDILLEGGKVWVGAKLLNLGLKAAGVSSQIIPEKTRAKFYDKVAQAVEVGKKKLSQNWERSVNALVEANPNQRVDMREPLMRLKGMMDGYSDENLVPQLMTAVNRSPKLMEVVKDPAKAIGLTLKESLELKNAVTSTTNAIIKKSVKGKTTPNERVVLEVLDQFDNQITKYFPGMRDVRRAYKAGKDSYDLARPLVEKGSAVESTILSKPTGLMGLGGTKMGGSTHGKIALQEIMSMTKPGGKMYEAAQYAHNLNRIADAVGRLGEISVGTALLAKITGKEVEV